MCSVSGANVFRPFTQRRQVNLKTVDAIEQVGAERSIVYHRIEIAVRRRDDANVDFDFAHAADAEEGARLDCAQKLCLQIRRQLSHFVQEQRSAVSQFNQSELASFRA